MTQYVRTAVLAALVALPSAALAGGYGTAGVKDATVGQSPTQTAMIWCPKINTEVPVDLHAQMDCGDGVAVGTAQPAVARERFGGRGLFGLPAHQPQGGTPDDGDGGTPTPVVTPPGGPDNPDVTPPDEPNEPPTGNGGTKTKWERMADFGITRDNYKSQPKEFRDSVKDFIESKGTRKTDWSGFEPPTSATE